MAYSPQNINLPVYTGMELLKLTGIGHPTGEVRHIIQQLGMIPDMLERSFDELSGGQKQRIVIAICLSLGRKIILLDEPTASLDDESVNRLISVIKNMKNTTVVSASHNHEWMRKADKVIML